MKNKRMKTLIYAALAVIGGYFWYQWDVKQELDAHYLDKLARINKELLYESSADTKEDLMLYQDHVEVCMHFDGYNGRQISNMKCKAIKKAALGSDKS